jgi:hypothetical protein
VQDRLAGKIANPDGVGFDGPDVPWNGRRAVHRQTRRWSTTLEEEHGFQTRIQELERRQRKQRQDIFTQEDEIADKRDILIAGLQKRLQRGQSSETLFTICWSVV